MTLILDTEVFFVDFSIMASYVYPSLLVFNRRSCLVFLCISQLFVLLL